MSVENIEQYQGKRVVVVYVPDGSVEAVELAGTAEAANASGIALKPTGKTKLELIDFGKIEDIRLDAEKVADIKRKALKPVVLGQARSHLAERHGYALTVVNGMTEDEAFKLHEAIDHVESDLGHKHEAKEASPAMQAQESTEESAA